MAVKSSPMPKRPAAASKAKAAPKPKVAPKRKPAPKGKAARKPKPAAPMPETRADGKRAARAASPRVQQLLVRLRKLCLGLPGTTEVEAWGHPTFRVNDKIFVGFGGDATGAASLGVKTTREMQSALVASDPRFTIAAYVGKHGWVNLDLGPSVKVDWGEIEALVHESYRLIAPAKLVQALDASE
jgi:predicted DNA-binding protein (MmcQ/YjbR family)